MSEQRDSAGFLYQIGDTLTHRGVPPAENGEAKFRLFVVERIYEERSGGTLKQYYCRVIAVSESKTQIHGDLAYFNEVELCPLPETVDGTTPKEFQPLLRLLERTYRYAIEERIRLINQQDFDGAAALRERTANFWETLRAAAKELMGEAGKE